jgi:hypothetical protein
MRIEIDNRWRVTAADSLEIPLSAPTLWGQMRDIRRFLAMDPLHAKVRFVDAPHGRLPRTGDQLVLEHRLLGVGVDRIGRLLKWREGRGYAISDLSRRGMRVGFPHVCMYEVHSIADDCSRLTIAVRGRWTARRLPRWLVRLWIAWVLAATRARLRREMAAFARWRRDQVTGTVTSDRRATPMP